MLSVTDLTYAVPSGQNAGLPLLEDISFTLPPGHFMAIVGPSGCGKTTLLKILAGLLTESSGRLCWRGQDLAEDGDLTASELGYVPQFSIAHDPLTIRECVENALRLRTCLREEAFDTCAAEVLESTGLTGLQDQRVAILSGGQKRRLGLAMELVSHPALLLCDEVISGLDPLSASEIILLLHRLSRQDQRTVVNVTHSLDDLLLYDSVLVLVGGRLAFHGPPHALTHYFTIGDPREIYPRLLGRSPSEWHQSWQKRSRHYYEKLELEPPQEAIATTLPATDAPPGPESPASVAESITPAPLPGFLRQLGALLRRRYTLFLRDRTQLFLHLALLLGFPLLVILFASDGIGALPENPGHRDLSLQEAVQIQARALAGQTRLGALISGLVMFQVILLTLMGANNSSREIAGERNIYEKERLAGLRPGAYLLSKGLFLTLLVMVQSVWMSLFVDHFAQLPGSLSDRTLLLVMVNGAMTATCLAISAHLRSPDQASLLSIYLVGFQLPLSGAVLALPAVLEKILQPLIAAYWSWTGQLAAMRPTDYFVAIHQAVPTPVITDPALPLTILGFHIAGGLVFAWIGCHRHQWI